MLTPHSAWQSFVPVANDLKLLWGQHWIKDIGWSQSIYRNSRIIGLFEQSHSTDAIHLHLEILSHLSPSAEGQEDGPSCGSPPTLTTAASIASRISQQGTTPTLSAHRSSTTSTIQELSPRPSPLASDSSTTSRRNQKRPTPCGYCGKVFQTPSNAKKHMRNASKNKCPGRPNHPEKVCCDVCGSMVGQYHIKNHRCKLKRSS